jgi:hypothetical protein
VTDPAISLAFFDPAREVHGTLRSGLGVLFAEGEGRSLDEPPSIERDAGGFHARCGDQIDLAFEPFSPAADLGGSSARVCRVRGKVAGRETECLGTSGETTEAPAWEELDALRLVSAIFDEERAVLLAARRPRGAVGHGDDVVHAHVLSGEQILEVEDARISTVYDEQGRQRTVGLELWLPNEDFPRRASGSVRAGMTLSLDPLRVDVAVVAWRMEGRDGIGAYEITMRHEPAAAAA